MRHGRLRRWRIGAVSVAQSAPPGVQNGVACSNPLHAWFDILGAHPWTTSTARVGRRPVPAVAGTSVGAGPDRQHPVSAPPMNRRRDAGRGGDHQQPGAGAGTLTGATDASGVVSLPVAASRYLHGAHRAGGLPVGAAGEHRRHRRPDDAARAGAARGQRGRDGDGHRRVAHRRHDQRERQRQPRREQLLQTTPGGRDIWGLVEYKVPSLTITRPDVGGTSGGLQGG